MRFLLDLFRRDRTNEPWQAWRGMSQYPMDPERFVCVRFRDGTHTKRAHPARKYSWPHYGGMDDIVAFKIVDEPQAKPSNPEE